MPAKKTTLRVLLADDHPLVREGLKGCLAGEPGIEVVGEAEDGAEAVRKAHELGPDLVLMDLDLPGLNGLEATAILRRELSHVRVLVFTIHHEPQYVTQAVKAGAHGYIAKDAPPSELLAAVHRVGRGGTYFSSKAAQTFLGAHMGTPGRNGATRVRALSARELDVLKLIVDGIGNKEIATRLGVGARTVETHRERIMRKLDIHTVAGLTRFAVAQGLVQLD
jgi:two-component system nitrate/nitrite response regulator NarL